MWPMNPVGGGEGPWRRSGGAGGMAEAESGEVEAIANRVVTTGQSCVMLSECGLNAGIKESEDLVKGRLGGADEVRGSFEYFRD